jgi:DNA-directed RNA polymerase sigma subunit (sigma70/sigma32)
MSDQYDRELVKRIKEGDELARSALEKQYFFMIREGCYGKMNSEFSFSELLPYAREGLMVAVENFDEERGFAFPPIAKHWIGKTIEAKMQNE